MLVGHRGLGRGTVGKHRENTVGSMLAALAAGADWLEIDVCRTADQSLVAHHNPALPDGRFLVDVRRAEAEDQGVVGLDTLVDALPEGVPVVLDVKSVLEDATDPASRRTTALLRPLLPAVVRHRQVLVMSFDPAALLELRDAEPGAAYGLLGWVDFPLRHLVASAAALRLDVVGVHHGSFRANRIEPAHVHRPPAHSIEAAHSAGLEVLAWCPEPTVAIDLVAAGVDALCLNDLPDAVPLLRAAVNAG